MDKPILISILVSAVLIGGALWILPSGDPVPAAEAVSMVGGTQFIDMTARGGYFPRVVEAKAGIPTVLRMRTEGTFDCSSSLVIPKLSYQKFLPPTGVEEIAIPAEKAQGTLQGLCSMGMYSFQVRFQ